MLGQVKAKVAAVAVAFRSLQPNTLATALTLGMTIGLLPIPGFTTAPLLAFAGWTSMPAAAITVAMAVNLLLTVPNLMMVPVFSCVGEAFLAGQPLSYAYSECQAEKMNIVVQARDAPLQAVWDSGYSILIAVLAFCIIFPVAWLCLYPVNLAVARIFAGGRGATSPGSERPHEE